MSGRASTALAGLALTANLARDATDGMPVVHAILGVISRILNLAERIDKDLEALRSLARKAATLSRMIEQVDSDNATDPDSGVLRSLENIHTSLRSIEEFFLKHTSRRRVRRVVACIFTAHSAVERMNRELQDAVQEFMLVAALDTNVRVKGIARPFCTYRQLNDYELHKQHLVADEGYNSGLIRAKYHSASVEGTAGVFVVRHIEWDADGDMELPERILTHDKILKELSTVERSHQHIAYLYGRSRLRHNRFVVLKSGVRPVLSIVSRTGPSIALVGNIAAKVLDAARHLQQCGAAWVPNTVIVLPNDIFLDERGEPTIGLTNDLRSAESIDVKIVYKHQFSVLASLFGWTRPDHSGICAPGASVGRSTYTDTCFDDILRAGVESSCRTNVIRHADLSELDPLNQETHAYLQRAAAVIDDGWEASSEVWGHILLRLATGCGDWAGRTLHAIYLAGTGDRESGLIFVHQIEGTGEGVQHVYSHVAISAAMGARAREKLGIVLPDSAVTVVTFEFLDYDLPECEIGRVDEIDGM